MATIESSLQTLSLSPNPECLHLLDFPRELLSSILEHLSSSSDRKSLSICAKLCKRLQFPSQELLFELWEPNTSCESDTLESLKMLSEILDVSPHLGRYIRTFWVFLGASSENIYSPSSTMYFGHSHRPTFSYTKPTVSNAYIYTARILPRLTHLKTLYIKPLGFEIATLDWSSTVDVPEEIRRAVKRATNGATLDRVVIESVESFDLDFFAGIERIKILELYGTSLPEGNTTNVLVPRSKSDEHKCRLGSITYYLGPGNSPSTFVDYCLNTSSCRLSFDSLTHLQLRDPADQPGHSPLTKLLEHFSSTLVHLELLYNTEIDSRWEPPNLSSLSYLKSLRLTLWLSPSFLRLPEITHQDRCQQALRLLNTFNTSSDPTLNTHLPDYKVSTPQVGLSTLILSFNVRHRFDVVESLLSKHKWDMLDEGLAELKQDGLESLKEVEMIYKSKVKKDMCSRWSGDSAPLPKIAKLGVDVSLSMESLYLGSPNLN